MLQSLLTKRNELLVAAFLGALALLVTGCPSGPGSRPTGRTPGPTSRWILVSNEAGDSESEELDAHLKRKAYDAISSTVPTLTRVIPEQHWETEWEDVDPTTAIRVSGTTPEYSQILQEAANVSVQQGRFLSDTDMLEKALVVVISAEQAERLNSDEPVGKAVRFGGLVFKVIGVLSEPASNRADLVSSDMYAPLTTLDSVVADDGSADSRTLSTLWLEALSIDHVDDTAEIVEMTLQRTQPDALFSVERAW